MIRGAPKHGDEATSQGIFTEYWQEKVDDPMKFTTEGKERMKTLRL